MPRSIIFCFTFLTSIAGDDRSISHSASHTMVGSVGRLVTPRSPGRNAFDVEGDSDDDGTELANEDEMYFNYGNLDASVNVQVREVIASSFSL